MRRSDCKAPAGAMPRADGPLWGRRIGLLAALAASALTSSLLAGCSGPILTFRADAAEGPSEPVSTGSISKPPKSFGSDLDQEDWRRAHAAMGVALDPQGNGRPVRWDNPETAMRGSISPTGLPYVSNDEVCRDFLASVVGSTSSRFVRGTGCKPSGGAWWLKRVRTAKS